MKINQQDYNDVTVVELHGEFIEEYDKLFTDTMSELVGKGRKGVVLEVSKMPFIDSVGLEKLLWLKDYCHEHHCHLKMTGLDDNFSKILEITRLDSDFDKHAELSEAVKSFT